MKLNLLLLLTVFSVGNCKGSTTNHLNETNLDVVECDGTTLANLVRSNGIVVEHGPGQVTLIGSRKIYLGTREYMLHTLSGNDNKYHITGYWGHTVGSSEKQKLDHYQPSYGGSTIIWVDTHKVDSPVQVWVFSLPDATAYPSNQAKYGNGSIQIACTEAKRQEFVKYLESSTPQLPTLEATIDIPYWQGFASTETSKSQIGDITRFDWEQTSMELTIRFRRCPSAGSCNYDSTSVYLIRLVSTRSSFVFWMTEDLTIRGQLDPSTHVASGLHIRQYKFHKMPDYITKRLRGETGDALKGDRIKLTVQHCWTASGSLKCSPKREKEMEATDSTCTDDLLSTRQAHWNVLHGVQGNAQVNGQTIQLGPLEYLSDIGKEVTWSISGSWEDSNGSILGVVDPSRGASSLIENSVGNLVVGNTIWAFRLNSPDSYPDHTSTTMKMTCDVTKNTAINNYLIQKAQNPSSTPTLPELTVTKTLSAWANSTFKEFDSAVSQIGDISQFAWDQNKKTLTISFKICEGEASSCTYKSTSRFLVRLQCSATTFLLWMGTKLANLKEEDDGTVNQQTYTITKTFTSNIYELPTYITSRLQGVRENGRGVKLLVSHCWGEPAAFHCNDAKSMVMPEKLTDKFHYCMYCTRIFSYFFQSDK